MAEPGRRAISGNAPRQRWQSRHPRHPVISNLQVDQVATGSDSLSLRHNADITGLAEMGSGTIYPSLWFLGYGFSILPNIDRRAVHSRNSPRSAGSGGHGPLHGFEEAFVFRRYFPPFHGPVSINRALFPELSYTIQASAIGLQNPQKFLQLRVVEPHLPQRSSVWFSRTTVTPGIATPLILGGAVIVRSWTHGISTTRTSPGHLRDAQHTSDRSSHTRIPHSTARYSVCVPAVPFTVNVTGAALFAAIAGITTLNWYSPT